MVHPVSFPRRLSVGQLRAHVGVIPGRRQGSQKRQTADGFAHLGTRWNGGDPGTPKPFFGS